MRATRFSSPARMLDESWGKTSLKRSFLHYRMGSTGCRAPAMQDFAEHAERLGRGCYVGPT